MQTLHQRGVLRFRVTDDDIIRSEQETVGDLSLGAEGLAGTRRTENQTIRVFRLLPIYHNQVIAGSVQSII